ncbi:MAG TPA: anti-sigma factor [Stellaceae bacterium]|nr:anti-sigma factor [Stellaceae bacterium]
MNTRPITEDDLHAYVDQALDPARQAEVAAYLEQHPEVARRVEVYASQRGELRTALAPLAEAPVPPELDLRRMIAARRRPGAPWLQAVAAVALVALGGAGGWSLHGAVGPEPGGITTLAQEAADNYSVYAADGVHPVEFKADERAELVSLASRRLERPVDVPELSDLGYRFMGGRVLATEHGPAVMFMYDNDRGTRLVLLSRTMKADQDAPIALHRLGSVAECAWADKGIGYSLAGHANSDILHPLADEIRKQVAGRT